ncbi:MAG: DUF938 domain-containing protein [Erythrobacter sp.]
MKRHAPATLRNRHAIGAVLEQQLPDRARVLEVASGSGEHALYFAEMFKPVIWQPSDPDPDAIASIAEYALEYSGDNLAPPVELDASRPESWPVQQTDAILCCNMVHISPWAATQGLFEGAAKVLSSASPLILYGPYFEQGTTPAQSNVDFDASLRLRNPKWGIRDVAQIDALGAKNDLARTARYEMPTNNLMLVYRRA